MLSKLLIVALLSVLLVALIVWLVAFIKPRVIPEASGMPDLDPPSDLNTFELLDLHRTLLRKTAEFQMAQQRQELRERIRRVELRLAELNRPTPAPTTPGTN